MIEEVVVILNDALANYAEKVNLSEKQLSLLLKAFGKMKMLLSLKLVSNQLKVVFDCFIYVILKNVAMSHLLVDIPGVRIDMLFIRSKYGRRHKAEDKKPKYASGYGRRQEEEHGIWIVRNM